MMGDDGWLVVNDSSITVGIGWQLRCLANDDWSWVSNYVTMIVVDGCGLNMIWAVPVGSWWMLTTILAPFWLPHHRIQKIIRGTDVDLSSQRLQQFSLLCHTWRQHFHQPLRVAIDNQQSWVLIWGNLKQTRPSQNIQINWGCLRRFRDQNCWTQQWDTRVFSIKLWVC